MCDFYYFDHVGIENFIGHRREVEGGDYCRQKGGWERERERDGDKGPCGERERDFGMVVVGELKRGSDGDGDYDGEGGGGGDMDLGDL